MLGFLHLSVKLEQPVLGAVLACSRVCFFDDCQVDSRARELKGFGVAGVVRSGGQCP